MSDPKGRSKVKRNALIAAGVGTALGLGVVAANRAVRRDRARPDPARTDDLAHRPGAPQVVESFDGTRLAAQVVGQADAPTIVFAHSFSQNLTIWHYQWRAFSERYRCVLFDHRGHGDSDAATDGDHSVEALGKDLKAVLDALVPEGPVALFGHSMGGMAILSLAEQHPEVFGPRVACVVLTNTGASDLVRAALGGLGSRAGMRLFDLAGRLTRDPARLYRIRAQAFAREANVAYAIARLTNFGPGAPPSAVEHVIAMAADARAEVWTDGFRSLLELDVAHALEHVTVPALVLSGDLDKMTPPVTGRALVEGLPDARLVEIEGAGHCMILDRHEPWNAAVEPFVDDAFARWKPPRKKRKRTAGTKKAKATGDRAS